MVTFFVICGASYSKQVYAVISSFMYTGKDFRLGSKDYYINQFGAYIHYLYTLIYSLTTLLLLIFQYRLAHKPLFQSPFNC